MAATRQQREKLIQHCRSGLPMQALAIIWKDPAIVRDSGCSMLWEGRNPTMLKALGWLSERLCVLKGAVLVGIEKRRPGWLGGIVRLPNISYEAYAAVLLAYVNGNSVWDLGLCGEIVRGLAAFGRNVQMDEALAGALSKLLVPEVGLDAESRGMIKSMLLRNDG